MRGDAVGAVARRYHDDAELVVGQRVQFRGEAVDRAAVADAAVAVETAHHEAEAEGAFVAGLGVLRLPHLFQRFRLHDHVVARLAAGEQHGQEARQVVDRGVEAAGRVLAERERRRRGLAAVVGPHHRLRQVLRHRGVGLQAAVLHAERVEDRPVDVARVGLPLRLLQHEADHGEARIAVFEMAFRGVNQLGPVEALHGAFQRRLVGVEVVADGRLAHQAGPVAHQLAERDGRVESVDRLEVRQDARDRGVEVEGAALDELHHGQVGEQLRHRADAVNGVGRGRRLGLRVGEAVAARPDDLLIVHQRDRQGGQSLGFDFVLDEGVEPFHGVLVGLGGRRVSGAGGQGAGEHERDRQGCDATHGGPPKEKNAVAGRPSSRRTPLMVPRGGLGIKGALVMRR